MILCSYFHADFKSEFCGQVSAMTATFQGFHTGNSIHSGSIPMYRPHAQLSSSEAKTDDMAKVGQVCIDIYNYI